MPIPAFLAGFAIQIGSVMVENGIKKIISGIKNTEDKSSTRVSENGEISSFITRAAEDQIRKRVK
jgi:hypothetical protein